METEELTLIEFTETNPPQIKSHNNWEEVYSIIRRNNDNHEDPYFFDVNGMTIMLIDDGEGNVSASLQTEKQSLNAYMLMGGVWVTLAEAV